MLSDAQVKDAAITTEYGCVQAIQPTYFRQGALEVRIYGAGSETFVRRCPVTRLRSDSFSRDTDPSHKTCMRGVTPLVSLAFSAQIYDGQRIGKPRSKEDALEDALKELKPQEAYNPEPVRVRQGYRAAPPHCSQREMYPVYQFDFRPKSGERYKDLPPRTIEVLAQDLGGKPIEETWECSKIR